MAEPLLNRQAHEEFKNPIVCQLNFIFTIHSVMFIASCLSPLMIEMIPFQTRTHLNIYLYTNSNNQV